MRPPRVITDSRVLAAMSHPARRRLLDALTIDGPLTVSALAARIGQAVGNVSHHIKVLAEADLVEEMPELARDRRERWWRVTDKRRRWSTTTFAEDPVGALVSDAALSLGLEHQIEKVRAWNALEESEKSGWTTAFSTEAWLHLTPEELGELSDELIGVFDRWRDRTEAAPGDGRRSVFAFARGVPADP